MADTAPTNVPDPASALNLTQKKLQGQCPMLAMLIRLCWGQQAVTLFGCHGASTGGIRFVVITLEIGKNYVQEDFRDYDGALSKTKVFEFE